MKLNNAVMLVILFISLIMAGYSVYITLSNINSSNQIRSEFKYADSVSESKLMDLRLEYVHLDSALKSSQAKTTQKKHDYESIEKPNVRIVTTVQLDSFWTNYNKP